jgi:RNA polymerase-binding transcription factor DksA
MNQADLDRYRQKLLALGRRVNCDLSGVAGEALRTTGGEASGSLSNAPLHPADLGTDNYEQETAASLMANETQLLEQVSAALARIDQGTYGRCQECGRDIDRERLNALLYTPYCVACAERLESEGAAPQPTGSV